MKKSLYLLSFVTLFTLAGKAQEPKKENPAPAKKEEKAQEPKKGTRMAINEKGVPASRVSKEKSGTGKEEKAPATTTQPTTTEKK